jgi:predicted  nucleic acid-binding Zn-ribbon protein
MDTQKMELDKMKEKIQNFEKKIQELNEEISNLKETCEFLEKSLQEERKQHELEIQKLRSPQLENLQHRNVENQIKELLKYCDIQKIIGFSRYGFRQL